jgi:sugar diacid utilization regulator
VDHNGEIAAAATALHQHQNTVRYRLRRAKALLDIENDFQFHEVMDIAVRLSRILLQE